MLKGRGKTFAPKKVAARKPGATPAPSSTRPTVEHQSQTPATSQPPQELPTTIAEKDATVTENAPLPNANTATISTTTATTSASQLKRKDREDEIQAPAAKRTAVQPELVAPQADSDPVARESAGLSESTAPAVATSGTSTTNVSKRKERAPLPSSPAKTSGSAGASTVSPTGISADKAVLNSPPITQSKSAATTSAIAPDSGTALDLSAPSKENANSGPLSENQNGGPSNPANRYPSPENMVPVPNNAPAAQMIADSSSDRVAGISGNGAGASSDLVEMASLNPDGTSGAIIEEPASGTERRKGKGNTKAGRKRIQTAADAEDDRATVNMSMNGTRRTANAKKPRKKRDTTETERRRKLRAETPEGASDEEIDPTVMTMADLTKDLKIGKKFSRYSEIKEMEEKKKQEAMKAKMRRKHPELASVLDANGPTADATDTSNAPNPETPAEGTAEVSADTPSENTASRSNAQEQEPNLPATEHGVKYRMLNGVIVMNPESLTIDRQANARKQQEAMEVVEENDFSHIVTQGRFMKREPSQSWDPAANQLFYRGLRQFGTDFQMIASMFPHRNRRQIKLKFNKEEKVNGAKINRILMNPKEPIDLDQFEKMSDMKLLPLEELEAEREKFDEEQRQEIARFEEAAAEATRKKREAIKGSDTAKRIVGDMSDESDVEEGFDGSNKENGKGKGKGSRRKGPTKRGRRGRNDDQGEIVGTID